MHAARRVGGGPCGTERTLATTTSALEPYAAMNAVSVRAQPCVTFQLAVERSDQRTVVTVRGELDLAVAPDLERVLADQSPDGGVVLDLRELSFIDASGLGLLAPRQHAGTTERHAVAPDPRRPRVAVTRALRAQKQLHLRAAPAGLTARARVPRRQPRPRRGRPAARTRANLGSSAARRVLGLPLPARGPRLRDLGAGSHARLRTT